MGKALVFYFEVWSNFQTFKNKTAGHAFLVGFRKNNPSKGQKRMGSGWVVLGVHCAVCFLVTCRLGMMRLLE